LKFVVNALRRIEGQSYLTLNARIYSFLIWGLTNPKVLSPALTLRQLIRIGVKALPMASLVALSVGFILAMQASTELGKLGANSFIPDLVSLSLLRELGPLLIAIIVVGRSGSAVAAELGTMKVNEEIDAMRTMGLDPVEVLVLPRLLAMIVALPLLTIYANLAALSGGALMVVLTLDIGVAQFLSQLGEAVTISTFWIGMVKAPVFALLIGLVGCYEGLQVSGSAESVGRRTTRSVVEAIFLVIVADAGFSILFAQMGL